MEEIIKDVIRQSGPITFAKYMEMALYSPLGGYYLSPRPLIGKEGDFYTSVHVHRIFGETLAVQVAEMAELLGPEALSVVEFGAGRGFLALDLLQTLAEKFPGVYNRLTYYIIERSPALKKQQQELLAKEAGDKVVWISEIDELNRPLRGCVISNELIDAFPVHLVEQRDGCLQEVYVDLDDDHFIEKTGPLSTPQLAEYFARLQVQLREGQRAEANLAALDWIREVGRCLAQGFVITIDYGYETPLLYHLVRQRGTLLCYHQHQLVEDPYLRVGEQDITAHVNFSALQIWGADAGLLTCGFTSQMRFLFGLGITRNIQGDRRRAEAVQQLVSPEGMGGIFKVLIQCKGLANPPLKGLSAGMI